MSSRLIVVLAVLGASVSLAEEPEKNAAEGPEKGLAGDIAKAKNGETVITSKKLEFDYRKYIAVFEGDVVATDPEIKMQADRMTIWFDETNNLKRALATGNVKMWYQDKTATGQTVVYDASKGQAQIVGNAQLARGKDSVSGDKITVWLNDDRMEVEPGRLIVYPQKEGSGGQGLKDLIPGKRGEKVKQEAEAGK